jgi:predicted transcriptional regulator
MLNSRPDNSNICAPELDQVKYIILKCINENPGIRYREILKLTGMTNGVLEYHLKALETSYKIINVDRHKPKTTRYYPIHFPSDESEILGYMRNDTIIKRIILFILNHSICTFNQIVEHTKKAPSTISWHLKRLRLSGIITSLQYNGGYHLYRITNEELMTRVLHKYENGLYEYCYITPNHGKSNSMSLI